MMNRLQHETSPYLLQHKDNPVDWYPWGEEAFQKAQAEDKPILLSVGYSACHWCHVMAHESFEDDATAGVMNTLFVNVKVDREERPDVDDIYMQAVQAMIRHGGWPMTVFLMPDGRPFYGGTYYPKTPRMGMPSFVQVMNAVHDAYINRRDDLEQQASELKNMLSRDVIGISGEDEQLNTELLDAAMRAVAQGADMVNGGFGGAPKFPQPMTIEFLLRSYHRTGEEALLDVINTTLTKMARGGMYDQIGGGFARYSVDDVWLVPHFEKMLYDNAQLSRAYLHAWQVTGNAYYQHIATETYDYILREMTAPEGGFYSATDADSEGEEGKFFVWSKAEIESILGDDAETAIAYYGVTEGGNFEGHNILNVPRDADVVADELDMDVNTLHEKIEAIKGKLYAHRTQRIAPGLDDKVLASWNGMMLASLAEAARIMDRDDYRAAAVRCGEFLTSTMTTGEGRLYRTSKNGESKLNAYLEDYANVIDAMLELYQTTFDEKWFNHARNFANIVLEHFRAEDGAGFFDTSNDHEELVVRPRNLQDNATPSGNGMMAKQLVRLAAYTGDTRYEEAARSVIRTLASAMRQYPLAFAQSLNAADMMITGMKEVAVVGEPSAEATQTLLNIIRTPYRPNVITALSPQNVDGETNIPLMNYRTMRSGQPTVYVCENFACQMPVTSPEDVERLLKV
ncbi:MAG: thioredoxin domain-containing protein [Chloroflexota bacterium]